MARRPKAGDPADEPVREEFRRAIGRRVFETRTRAGLSQDELAAAAGITKGYVFEIENYGANPTAEALLVLSRTLKVGVRDLLPETQFDLPAAPAIAELGREVARLAAAVEAVGRWQEEAKPLLRHVDALMARLRRAFPETDEGAG